jgi:AcrR family transcriptional regulator
MHQPRKQARQARSRVTQTAIVEATARLLETKGRNGLTTNAIADRAGVSVGSLYQYFPNKEAILATLIRDKRQQLLMRMQQVALETQDAPPDAALDALVRAGMMHQYDRPALSFEIEYIEQRLELADETATLAEDMAQLVLATVRRLQPSAGLQEARDVVAITKGLINAAAMASEPGGDALFARARRAVLGYLSQIPKM